MTETFHTIKRRRLSDEVSAQIQLRIASGELRSGDKLPPERELAVQLGVSRGAVREALRTLERTGLVSLQAGSRGGAFIGRGNPGLIGDSFRNLYQLGSVSLDELTEARQWLESTVVRIVAKRATKNDLATLEANALGQIRTGAASGVATKYLAREDADILGVIGSGFQAETQIAAISTVRALKEVRVWSRQAEKRADFARKCADKFGLNVRATHTAREAVEHAGIVVTATSSKEPVLESAWISPGTHINAMGSNWLIKRELPPDLVLEKAYLVTVDSVEDAHLESGDLVIPGAPFRGEEFYNHMNGSRSSAEQITIFKSNGLAIQDVVCAGYLYEQLLKGLPSRDRQGA